jgi:uncharacterized Zn finger protein
MTTDFQITIQCPRCHRDVRQQGRLVQDTGRITCSRCGAVELSQDDRARVKIKLHDAEQKFAQLGGNVSFKLK